MKGEKIRRKRVVGRGVESGWRDLESEKRNVCLYGVGEGGELEDGSTV